MFSPRAIAIALTLAVTSCIGCKDAAKSTGQSDKHATTMPLTVPAITPGTPLKRNGDEIMVAGQLFHTGTPIVLWTDEGGYDAYRFERRFAPLAKAGFNATTQEIKDIGEPARYGLRSHVLNDDEIEKYRGGGWDLAGLQQHVDQFVIHFDVCGTSRQCFNILHDHRGLSVHFMLDVDGTIYQTLDLKERAFQATIANPRSVGIEIANIGAYGEKSKKELDSWYRKDADGKTRLVFPAYIAKNTGIRTPNFVGRPMRNDPVTGNIQGDDLTMYDLTPEQYKALIRLTATLCTVLPKINCDAPRGADGKVTTVALPAKDWDDYQGLLGHYHVQTNKNDPGPAFQWEYLIAEARKLMTPAAKARNKAMLGHPVMYTPNKLSKPATTSTSGPTTNPTTAPKPGSKGT